MKFWQAARAKGSIQKCARDVFEFGRTMPPGGDLFRTNKPSRFHMNLIYTINFRVTARWTRESRVTSGELEARGINSLTRFLESGKLCQDMRCHYAVMKIYNRDTRRLDFFRICCTRIRLTRFVLHLENSALYFRCESPPSGIPDYYDPNNSQTASHHDYKFVRTSRHRIYTMPLCGKTPF